MKRFLWLAAILITTSVTAFASDETIIWPPSFLEVEVKAGKPKKALHSTLPVSYTFVSSTLNDVPPEPGPENNLTISGVDSDGDGIRDDIQRYIAMSYPTNMAIRMALMDVAKSVQLILTGAESKVASYQNMLLFNKGFECTAYTIDDDPSELIGTIISKQNNTRERTKAYALFHKQISGYVSVSPSLDDYYKSCSFDIKAMLDSKRF